MVANMANGILGCTCKGRTSLRGEAIHPLNSSESEHEKQFSVLGTSILKVCRQTRGSF